MNFSKYSDETKDLADLLLQGKLPLSKSHIKMIDLVEPNSRVLEIGCANGFMSAKMKEKGCVVTGVELDSDFAKKAKENLREVVIGNIEDENVLKAIKGKFNHIMFGDILEHLTDPFKVVKSLLSSLSPQGTIIASLPNICIWWMRRDMLRGRFLYTDTGLLDRTHLRFFSYCTAKQFFNDLNLDIKDIFITSNDYPLKQRLIKLMPRFTRSFERFGDTLAKKRPNLFGFHFVFVVRQKSI
jgi:2-polyprenyl-3-methyl-5-hydroxy-6-metoxy-1,4-benzoquinol methylase